MLVWIASMAHSGISELNGGWLFQPSCLSVHCQTSFPATSTLNLLHGEKSSLHNDIIRCFKAETHIPDSINFNDTVMNPLNTFRKVRLRLLLIFILSKSKWVGSSDTGICRHFGLLGWVTLFKIKLCFMGFCALLPINYNYNPHTAMFVFTLTDIY